MSTKIRIYLRPQRRGSANETLRTGMHKSGLIADTVDNRRIILYKTGINHAGEFMDEILAKRSL